MIVPKRLFTYPIGSCIVFSSLMIGIPAFAQAPPELGVDPAGDRLDAEAKGHDQTASRPVDPPPPVEIGIVESWEPDPGPLVQADTSQANADGDEDSEISEIVAIKNDDFNHVLILTNNSNRGLDVRFKFEQRIRVIGPDGSVDISSDGFDTDIGSLSEACKERNKRWICKVSMKPEDKRWRLPIKTTVRRKLAAGSQGVLRTRAGLSDSGAEPVEAATKVYSMAPEIAFVRVVDNQLEELEVLRRGVQFYIRAKWMHQDLIRRLPAYPTINLHIQDGPSLEYRLRDEILDRVEIKPIERAIHLPLTVVNRSVPDKPMKIAVPLGKELRARFVLEQYEAESEAKIVPWDS